MTKDKWREEILAELTKVEVGGERFPALCGYKTKDAHTIDWLIAMSQSRSRPNQYYARWYWMIKVGEESEKVDRPDDDADLKVGYLPKYGRIAYIYTRLALAAFRVASWKVRAGEMPPSPA
ncbi:MAG: hypothetical protein AAB605_02475 [Patescibacteria group bacterium]